MFVIIYHANDGTQLWKKALTEDDATKFVSDNGIKDYDLTVDGYLYRDMEKRIQILEKRIQSLKDFINKIDLK